MAGMSTMLQCVALDFGIQAAAGAVAIGLGTEMFYDLAGASTFVLVTGLSMSGIKGRLAVQQQALSGMVLVWSARLGAFLFNRALQAGGDRRFTKAKQNPKLFAFYWFLQGVWVLMTMLPVLTANAFGPDPASALAPLDYLGWAMFGVGFAFETIADVQKYRFRSDNSNKDKFIQHGLWALSRHPNYFGEILLQAGVYVSSLSMLSGWGHLAALSPIFTAWLLTRVSGIPLLERHATKRWGDSAEYKAYAARTPVLFPRLF